MQVELFERGSCEMSRVWAMPNPYTFQIPAISDLLAKWLKGRAVILDPFCGASMWASHSNDLALGGVDAGLACEQWRADGVVADAVLFDPPYSPRQITEVYKSVGLDIGTTETQNAALYRRVRDSLDILLKPGGVALSFGWNSVGFGSHRGYSKLEIMLVCHGGAHNDTVCVVEQKV
jgi:hypothetical protein